MIKIYKIFGLLKELIDSSIKKVIPFMIVFFLWTLLFAYQFYILKSNTQDVQDFEGTNKVMGYFLLAFENGIGNIVPPTVEEW